MLQRLAKEKLVQARGVVAFYPANSVGDDIALYKDEERNETVATLFTLRQQMENEENVYRALADYVAPKETGL